MKFMVTTLFAFATWINTQAQPAPLIAATPSQVSAAVVGSPYFVTPASLAGLIPSGGSVFYSSGALIISNAANNSVALKIYGTSGFKPHIQDWYQGFGGISLVAYMNWEGDLFLRSISPISGNNFSIVSDGSGWFANQTFSWDTSGNVTATSINAPIVGGITTNIDVSFGTTNFTLNFTNGVLMGKH